MTNLYTSIDQLPITLSAPQVAKVLGVSEVTGKDVRLLAGRFGPYVKDGATNASLPKTMSSELITLDEALELLAVRAAKGPVKKKATKKAVKKVTEKAASVTKKVTKKSAKKTVKKTVKKAAKKTTKKTAKKAVKKTVKKTSD